MARLSLSHTLTTPEGVIVTLVSRDCCPYLDDYDPGCSVAAPAVLNAPLQPVLKLTLHGTNEVVHRLQDVKMVRSARKAVTGDGVCIGLTYTDRAFIHPKTVHN